MPVLQLPLKRRNLHERSTAHRGGYLPEGFEEGTIAGGRRRKSLVRSLLRIFAGAHVRCGVKLGNTRREHMFSALPLPTMDIGRHGDTSELCPTCDIDVRPTGRLWRKAAVRQNARLRKVPISEVKPINVETASLMT